MTTKKNDTRRQLTREQEIAKLAREQSTEARSAEVWPDKPRAPQNGRHDLGAPPNNYTFVGDWLCPTEPHTFGPAAERTVAIAQKLLVNIGAMFRIADGPGEAPRILGGIIKQLLFAAKPKPNHEEPEALCKPNHEAFCRRAEALEKAHEAFFGYRFGEREWWEDPLVGQLKTAVLGIYEREHRKAELSQRVRDRKRGIESARANVGRTSVPLLGKKLGQSPQPPPGAFEEAAPGTEGVQILAYLQWVADGCGNPKAKQALPPELTAKTVQIMIAHCAPRGNRAGGGRKPAEILVAEFKATLR